MTFEGGEGAGKSTHIAILADALRAAGFDVVCLREPGGTRIGESLRSVVLDPDNAEMADMCELFVYEAARAQLVGEKIAPALACGSVVLCDRFCDSTIAYQAYGRGLDEGAVRRANELACQGIAPDRTVVLEAPSAALGLARAARVAAADRLERAGETFHVRVNEAFRAIAAAEPDRVRAVVSHDSIEDTARGVFFAVEDLFEGLSLDVMLHAARALACEERRGC
ncbi:MAG: dTMP kinase [Slackia sp.]|nr:dTMP kinase [Slackia sp.]